MSTIHQTSSSDWGSNKATFKQRLSALFTRITGYYIIFEESRKDIKAELL
jgi:hypothetical protein